MLGYVEALRTGRAVYALAAQITLGSIDDDDRRRVEDLLGHLDLVDPVVTVDDKTIAIEAIVSNDRRHLRALMRGMLEHVAGPLHDARRVVVVQFAASTAARDQPYSAYR